MSATPVLCTRLLHPATTRWGWRLVLGVCLLGWLLTTPQLAGATAPELVQERAWFEDKTGQLSWAEAQRQPTQPVKDVLSAGYGKAPVWLRLRINPAAAGVAPDSRLVLRVRPAYLDEVTLFDPLQTPPQRPSVGDHYPASAQVEAGTSFVYHLPAGAEPRDMWLRLHTQSARLVYAEVMTPQAYQLSVTRLEHLSALYLGLVAVFLLWGLVQAVIKPEPVMLSFVFYQASALAVGASLWGYSNLLLSDLVGAQTVDLITNVAILLSSSSVILFSHFVLDEVGKATWRNWVFVAILALYPVLMGAELLGYTSWALQMNMTLILLVPLVLWGLAVASPTRIPNDRRKTPRGLSKALVVAYFSLTLVFTLMTAAPALGLVQGVEISLYIVFLYSISTGVLMLMMLQYRAWIRLRQHSAMQAAAEQAAQVSALEHRNREDRELLLAMLGHELKTPLATLRMLLANRQVPQDLSHQLDRSVTDMSQVVERALQSGLVETQALPVHLQHCDLHALLGQLCQELPGAERLVWHDLGQGPAQVQSDPALLRTVLRQLMDNALKYSPPNAPVHVRWQAPDTQGHWALIVCNPPGRAGWPDAAQVFVKYYRSPLAQRVSGAGLGLYMARGLVRRLGGDLLYQPTEGQVCFCLKM